MQCEYELYLSLIRDIRTPCRVLPCKCNDLGVSRQKVLIDSSVLKYAIIWAWLTFLWDFGNKGMCHRRGRKLDSNFALMHLEISKFHLDGIIWDLQEIITRVCDSFSQSFCCSHTQAKHIGVSVCLPIGCGHTQQTRSKFSTPCLDGNSTCACMASLQSFQALKGGRVLRHPRTWLVCLQLCGPAVMKDIMRNCKTNRN